MKRLITLLASLQFCLAATSYAQTSSVYSLETEYTTSFGYRYFFSKINSTTGSNARLAQMPVKGFYNMQPFMNSSGYFVFMGIDSAASPSYKFFVYEIDTAGSLVRKLPIAAQWPGAPGPAVIHLFQSPNCTKYYGIRWKDSDRELISMDPVTGADTVLTTITADNCVPKLKSAIDGDNNIYFFESEGTMGYTRLYKASVTAKSIVKTDSILSHNTSIYNLFYDCNSATVYGFYLDSTVTIPNMHGAEWIKINNATGAIMHTGTKFNALSSSFYAYTTLSNGDYYQLDDMYAYFRFKPAAVTGTVYNIADTAIAISTGQFTTLTAPQTSCGYIYNCPKPTDVNKITMQHKMSIYPNPAHDEITINAGDAIGADYNIMNHLGQQIASGNLQKALNTISIATLPAGAYYVRIRGKVNGTLGFVKQ